MRGIMENKRGLSAIVATLIIILLVLVAVGIIWVVVRNVIQGGTEQVDINTKCLAVDLSAVSVNENEPPTGVYDITLRRSSGGDVISGVKVALFNDTANSGVLNGFNESETLLGELETKTDTFATTVIGANKLEFTVYFVDTSGTERLCSQTNTYTF